jgi:aspartate-semialdehyde dehydrogenase
MANGTQPIRVAIVGASSLRGKDLKEVLEEGAFSSSEIRLFDEVGLAGTLTEAGGEPVVIQTVDEESFHNVRVAFFAGGPEFAAAHWQEAERARASIIDLSGGLEDVPSAASWIPALDSLLPPPKRSPGAIYLAPSTTVITACSAAAGLAPFGLERMAIVFLQPVSERGEEGVSELETQSVKLLSFQPIAREVFDAQVAFNLIDRYGEESREKLSDSRGAICRAIRKYLEGRAVVPAVQIIQAPVFYSTAFSIYAELKSAPDAESLARAAEAAGITVTAAGKPAPSNVSVAGESQPVIGGIERDPNVERGWWIWGAADNLRVSVTNAVQIAEKLLAS